MRKVGWVLGVVLVAFGCSDDDPAGGVGGATGTGGRGGRGGSGAPSQATDTDPSNPNVTQTPPASPNAPPANVPPGGQGTAGTPGTGVAGTGGRGAAGASGAAGTPGTGVAGAGGPGAGGTSGAAGTPGAAGGAGMSRSWPTVDCVGGPCAAPNVCVNLDFLFVACVPCGGNDSVCCPPYSASDPFLGTCDPGLVCASNPNFQSIPPTDVVQDVCQVPGSPPPADGGLNHQRRRLFP